VYTSLEQFSIVLSASSISMSVHSRYIQGHLHNYKNANAILDVRFVSSVI
jgi:hypothetical protein